MMNNARVQSGRVDAGTGTADAFTSATADNFARPRLESSLSCPTLSSVRARPSLLEPRTRRYAFRALCERLVQRSGVRQRAPLYNPGAPMRRQFLEISRKVISCAEWVESSR